MKEISRDLSDLVTQTIGPHHQYPDGLMLFLGTLFAPARDGYVWGKNFTRKIDDRVTLYCKELGSLTNAVRLSTECPEWAFGVAC